MDSACGAAHGYWRGRGARSARLSGLLGAGCGQLFRRRVVVRWFQRRYGVGGTCLLIECRWEAPCRSRSGVVAYLQLSGQIVPMPSVCSRTVWYLLAVRIV
jgi:hypothetical protein